MIAFDFDGFDMTANDFNVTDFEGYSPARFNVQIEQLANEDGGVEVDRRLSNKIIPMQGWFKADTVALMDDKIDDFLRNMNKTQRPFIVGWGSGSRTFTATPQNIQIARPKGLNLANYSLEMATAQSYGLNDDSEVLLNTTITSSSSSDTIDVGGSYKAQPTIIITVSSVTGGTSQAISVTNGKTFAGITVTRTWAASDTLEIDSLNKTVLVNDSIVDFSGNFPEYQPGSQTFQYNDGFTARSVGVTVSYKKKFI